VPELTSTAGTGERSVAGGQVIFAMRLSL